IVARHLALHGEIPTLYVCGPQLIFDWAESSIDRVGKAERVGIDVSRRRDHTDRTKWIRKKSVKKIGRAARERRCLLGDHISIEGIVEDAVRAADGGAAVPKNIPGKPEPRSKIVPVRVIEAARPIPRK